jgi:O-antigen ligase/Flp pilus assembly protein TadD
MNSLLRQLLIIGLCLVPFIPLIVATPFFFPFITGKNFAFRILVEVCFALWAILALRDPAMRPKWSALPVVMLAFLVSAGISMVLAENPGKAFWSNFERMEGWIGLLHSTAYFFVLWLTMNSEKLWSRFWNASIIVASLIGAYGLMQLGGMFTINQGGVRVDGTLGNATYLAVYMLFHVFVTLFYLVKTWKTEVWLRYLYIPALVLQAFMIFYSATRGTILGLMGGLFLTALIMLFTSKDNALLKKWGIGVIIALVAVGGLFFAAKDTEFVQNHDVLSRIAGISLAQGETRFTIWGMAWQGFLERPIFGWGQEGFNYVFNKYYEPSLFNQEPWFDRAHNAFIDWLIAGGIIGFLLYTSLYPVALWLIWRKESSFSGTEKSIFTGLLAAYAFHNLFVFDNLVSYVFFMSSLAYICYRSYGAIGAAPSAKPLPENTAAIAAPAIAVVMALVFYFANVPGMATAANIISGLSPHDAITENFDYFKKAAENTGLGRQETREQLLQFAIQVRRLNAGDGAFQNDVAQFAVAQMQDEIKRVPNDARLNLFLGSFLSQMGQNDAALPYLTNAQAQTPGKQTAMFELGIFEFNRGNGTAAVEWLKKAYELLPSNEMARTLYAAMLIRAGAVAEAEALMMEGWGTVTPDRDEIMQVYFETKNYARVVAILDARIGKNPADANLQLQKAAVLLPAGDRQGAIAALRKAIELDPAFKEQGEFYISEIQAGRNP